MIFEHLTYMMTLELFRRRPRGMYFTVETVGKSLRTPAVECRPQMCTVFCVEMRNMLRFQYDILCCQSLEHLCDELRLIRLTK